MIRFSIPDPGSRSGHFVHPGSGTKIRRLGYRILDRGYQVLSATLLYRFDWLTDLQDCSVGDLKQNWYLSTSVRNRDCVLGGMFGIFYY
jgi:hypothetical protein